MKKTVSCIICPNSCEITVTMDDAGSFQTEGALCKRGEEYAIKECTAPMRTFTGSVRILNADRRRIPVRSSAPVPKGILLKVAEELRGIELSAPIPEHQVLIRDIEGSGADIITTMAVERSR